MKTNKTYGEIKSNQGFYVGDISYALTRETYLAQFGENGLIEGSNKDGTIVITNIGSDGDYKGSDGVYYSVDASNIGIVPIELVDDIYKAQFFGRVVNGGGTATLTNENRTITVSLPNGTEIVIKW